MPSPALGNSRGEIVVAVPTFRRPELLTVLLDGLVPQAAAAGARVIVGDNASAAPIRALVEGYRPGVDIHYLAVPERGVSQVRNALVAEALRAAPGWRWLLMLDDDGQVTPGWLERIVACGERFAADLVGGPVEGVLPDGAGALARNSIFARRRRWPTGRVAMLNTTQNLAIGRPLLDRIAPPLFNSRFGASGGEDYDLFRQAIRAGGTLVWCDEAVVVEPAPADRLTTRALLHRYYSTGVYMSPIDASYDGWAKGAFGAVKGVVKSGWQAATGVLTGRADRTASGVLALAHYSGRVAGLAGARSARYGKTKA